MTRYGRCLIGLFASLVLLSGARAEEIRDYYQEPGLTPYKSTLDSLNESINPFSGALTLSHVDVSVPGNGGLDINITRFYNHLSDEYPVPNYYSTYGIGWTMHFGRIVMPGSSTLCADAPQVAWDNPSFELPDGSRQLLVRDIDGSGDYVSHSNWRGRCDAGQMTVISPDGTRYLMRALMEVTINAEGDKERSWLVSRIEDVHGNWIDVVYRRGGNGYLFFDTITSNDGREVVFEYDDSDGGCYKLQSIASEGRVWQYHYGDVSASGWNEDGRLCGRYLTGVTLPSGESWSYTYYPDNHLPAGQYSLESVTNPYGGVTTYTYGHVRFRVFEYQNAQLALDFPPGPPVTVVAEKHTSGPGVTEGTWRYEYNPSSWRVSAATPLVTAGCQIPVESGLLDTTTVWSPDTVEVFFHIGAWTYLSECTDDDGHRIIDRVYWTPSTIGQLNEQDTFDPAGLGADGLDLTQDTPVQRVMMNWGQRKLSDEIYQRDGFINEQSGTFAPVLLQRAVIRDGVGLATLYADYDRFGNPGTRTETDAGEGGATRVSRLTYYNDPDRWVIGRPDQETVEGVLLCNPPSEPGCDGLVHDLTIDREYDPVNANLLSQDRYGVITRYTYDASGNLETLTDSRGNITRYSDYYRGTPQTETFEDHTGGGGSRTLTRVVNGTGTAASVTNGRGFATGFEYDGIGRVKRIDFPVNTDVAVDYGPSYRRLVRGNFQQTEYFDGFGRTIRNEQGEAGQPIVTTQKYDALGRRTFVSYPDSTDGTRYTHDIFGRTSEILHPDGSKRTFTYLSAGLEVQETDERGNTTQRLYNAYGAPDNDKALMYIATPEGVHTLIGRNVLNQTLYIHQGEKNADGQVYGYTRTFSYDGRTFLIGEDGPETEPTSYGRDAAGNMIARQIGTEAPTEFVYDGLNRLIFTDYPEGTPDVTRVYDGNDNLISVETAASALLHGADGTLLAFDNPATRIDYGYDANDNRVSESHTIGAALYTLNYSYNGNDALESLTYPTGRQVSYAPDALGRSTQAAPFITALAYHPSAQLSQITYPNGHTTDISLDQRLRVSAIAAAGVIERNYGYDVAGNVLAIDDLGDPDNGRTLSYDNLDRLVSARRGSEPTVQFGYDVFGNIASETTGDTASPESSEVYSYAYLRLMGVSHYNSTGALSDSTNLSYDPRGNVESLLKWAYVAGLPTPVVLADNRMSYDPAGRLRIANVGDSINSRASNLTYYYDGTGARAGRVQDGELTHYLYSSAGQLLGEYGQSGALNGKEHIYVGSQRLASVQTNELPHADAGADQVVYGSQTVTLDGTGSSDPDGAIAAYAWVQSGGTFVPLSNATSAQAHFTAPVAATAQTLVFTLTVTDNDGESDTATVTVQVQPNSPPVADAGADQSVIAGTAGIYLDGTGSYDNEGPVTYLWQQVSGPTVALNGRYTATPNLVTWANGTHYAVVLRLTVTDSVGLTASDEVTIEVLDPTLDADADGLPDAFEIVHFGDIASFAANDDPDGDGLSNLQEYQEGTDPMTPEPPPTQLTGVMAGAGDQRAAVRWDQKAGVAAYNLYWSTQPISDPAQANKVSGVSEPYVLQGLTNGTTYYLAVAAANGSGESPLSLDVTATPGTRVWSAAEPLVPTSGTDLKIDSDLAGNLTIAWEDNGVWAMRFTPETGWSAPVQLTDYAAADSLQLSMGENGDAVAVWVENQVLSSADLYAAVYRKANDGWSQKVNVDRYTDTSHGWDRVSHPTVAMHQSGYAIAAWLQYSTRRDGSYISPYNTVYASVMAADGTWGPRILLDNDAEPDDSYVPSVAIGPNGEGWVTWIRHDWDVYWYRVYARRYSPSSGWDTDREQAYYTPLALHTHVMNVSINTAGDVLVGWAQYKGQAAFRKDGYWHAAANLDSSSSPGFPDSIVVSLADDGTATFANASSGDTKVVAFQFEGLTWSRADVITRKADVGKEMRGHKAANVGQVLSWLQASVGTYATYRPETGWSAIQSVDPTEPIDLLDPTIDRLGNLAFAWVANGEIWAKRWYPPGPPTNQPPHADAGADQNVVTGALVQLDGSASSDNNGTIASYAWSQTAGPAVSLSDPASPAPTFTAPLVATDTTLSFRLGVTDNAGASAFDEVAILVLADTDTDTTPPQTTAQVVRTTVKGAPNFDVTLSANEPASIWFRVTGSGTITAGGSPTTDWQRYTGPVHVANPKKGVSSFDYYAIDTTGNQEAIKTEVLQ